MMAQVKPETEGITPVELARVRYLVRQTDLNYSPSTASKDVALLVRYIREMEESRV